MTRQYTTAFVLSMLAGVLILGTVGMMYGIGHGGSWMWEQGMMRGMTPMMSGTPMTWWPWFGVLTGVTVLVGAVMLYSQPAHHGRWGLVILIASAMNVLVGMGGLFAGAVGVIGGSMAIPDLHTPEAH